MKERRRFDGGSAFPVASIRRWNNADKQLFDSEGQEGMSLRDFFAGMAMQEAIRAATTTKMEGNNIEQGVNLGNAAVLAYGIADAMLKEREK